MTTCISALGLALALAAGEGPGTVAKSGTGRIAAVEKELCSAACPPIAPDASSDWLRSADGQRANACRTGCRVEQPASALFQSACDAASSGSEPSTPVVILAGKEGPELARRLRAALKDGDGKRPTALCARARATLASSDELAYMECVGRVSRTDGAASVAAPQPARGLRCATVYVERDVEWLKRCPAVETAALDACLERAEAAPRARRQSAADVKAQCEGEALDRIAASFRHRSRP